MQENLIQVINLRKTYNSGSLHALDGVSLDVHKGDVIVVIGPSGSGKSTLMNVLGCMDNVQSGEYFLAGLPIHEMDEKGLTIIRNHLIGFIFQRYHLIATYNVLQNVMMPLLVRGASHREAQLAALEQLARLGMEKRIYHNPNELSGGQQQRVAIARALVGRPRLLLADEPTGALDSNTGKEVMKLFGELNEQGHTIVMITHDAHIAEYAKRTVRIIDGELSEQA